MYQQKPFEENHNLMHQQSPEQVYGDRLIGSNDEH